uniref:Apolipophorin n=1 Tax=Syphacia muris TaxID=451379 RepID=A0A0N5AYW7_9BILA
MEDKCHITQIIYHGSKREFVSLIYHCQLIWSQKRAGASSLSIKTIVENGKFLSDKRKINAFNISFDKLELQQKVTDAVVTAFHPVAEAFVTFTADKTTIEKLKIGLAIPSNQTDITLVYDDKKSTVTYQGGLIQFTSTGSNSLTFQAFDGDFVDNAGYKLLKNILMDTIYIENISPNLLDNLTPTKRTQLTLTKCDDFGMEIVIKHNECNLAKIVSNGVKLNETILTPAEHFSSRTQLEDFFLVGGALYLSGGEMKFGNNETKFIGNKSKCNYEGDYVRIVDPSNGIDIRLEETKLSCKQQKPSVVLKAILNRYVLINTPFVRYRFMLFRVFGTRNTEAKTARTSGSSTVLVLLGGYVEALTTVHRETIIDLDRDSRIIIKNGKIWRTMSKEYVITRAEMVTVGNVLSTCAVLQDQSLLRISSQKKVTAVVDQLTEFLENNDDEFNYDELDSIASSILKISGEVSKSVKKKMLNPLECDKQAVFEEEQAIYDELFLKMNLDGNIRYVDEYSEKEWAEQATILRQREESKAMVASVQKLMESFENVLGKMFLQNITECTSYSKEENGVGLTLRAGSAEKLFQDSFYCRDWMVGISRARFPPKLGALGHPELENENIVVAIVCFDINPYQYLANYNPLITSGPADIKLKTSTGNTIPKKCNEIRLEIHFISSCYVKLYVLERLKDLWLSLYSVQNAIEPVEIRFTSSAKIEKSVAEAYSIGFSDYQILNFNEFRTKVWNSSLYIEFKSVESVSYEGEIWIFVAFQRLPGPLPEDHDWRFLVDNKNEVNNFVIDSSEMINKTGLFYIGVGCALHEPKNDTETVEYRGGNSKKYFENKLPISYTLRVIAKGCFYVNGTLDLFHSYGLKPSMLTGSKVISCFTNHLTTFSIGITGLTIPNTFEYVYEENTQPANHTYNRSAVVAIIIAIVSLFCGFVAMLGYNHDKLDICKGRMRYMEDNYYNTYFYMIAVQTGYCMFASTDSNMKYHSAIQYHLKSDLSKPIFINLIGTSGATLARKLKSKSKMGEQFRWGTTERFIMSTDRYAKQYKQKLIY